MQIIKNFGRVINDFFAKGHKRSIKAKKNIIRSFGIKGVVILISFVRVPIVISYLDTDKYGIWLTIASIANWLHHFDLGIGHGLRNKFAQAISANDHERARKLVSTAYFYLSLIFSGIAIIIIPVVLLLDWQEVLNTTTISQKELQYTVLFVLMMFVFRFVFNLITVILKADQQPALSEVFLPIGSVVSLLLIIGLKYFSKDSLFLASIVISVPPVLTLALSNLFFFRKRYKKYRPSLKWVDKNMFKDIFSLGMKFFYVQLSSLVLFSSSNIILIQYAGPVEVTVFNIARQFFRIPLMVYRIIASPFWSAITEAYSKNEYKWIKNAMRKYNYVAILLSFATIVLLVLSPYAYKVWLGSLVKIPFQISVLMAIYTIASLIVWRYGTFINGVGKLKLSTWVVTFKVITFLPLAISATTKLGAIGLVIVLIVVNSIPSAYFGIKQYNLLINKKATGIWNK